MTAHESWQEQREELSREISRQADMNSVIYAVRHALLQTEQNVLAAQNDDVLRQQMGVLFALLKNSITLLNVPVSSTTWTTASRRDEQRLERGFPILLIAAVTVLAAIGWNYARGDLLSCLLMIAAVVLCITGLLMNRKNRMQSSDSDKSRFRVTHSVDAEQLLSAIDAQILMIDRCSNDFAYLNQSLRAPSGAGAQNLEPLADLLEAVYAYDDDLREQAGTALEQLMRGLGLEAMEYSPENQKMFNQLPSKNMTRTLCPAILSAEDHRLLRRGTAVVSKNAA